MPSGRNGKMSKFSKPSPQIKLLMLMLAKLHADIQGLGQRMKNIEEGLKILLGG